MFAATVGVFLLSLLHGQSALPLRVCAPQGVSARCGTLLVPENRSLPSGRKIGLNIVVIPAVKQPAVPDAFTYLSGGPGGAAATEMPSTAVQIWSGVHRRHDILLVDQRGTGRSNPLLCPTPKEPVDTEGQRSSYVRSCIASLKADPSQYGTRAAVEDLQAVRAALGYRRLDIYGTSYGATVAQMFLKAYPNAVRTVTLDGATFTDIPFYARYAVNGQAALNLRAKECAAQPACRKAFPNWRGRLGELIAKWNKSPQKLAEGSITGDGLAGVVQGMLITADNAARIPLLVSRASAGDYAPLVTALGATGGIPRSLMYWTIMCNEPWAGLDSHGPWGTFLDGLTTYTLTQGRSVCTYISKHPEPDSAWRRVRSTTPTLVLAGEADPQDPIANLPRLTRALPNSRLVIARGQGHAVGQYGCLGTLVSQFVERGTATKLNASCARTIKAPQFAVR